MRLRPNTICCNSALSACGANGNWQIALQMLNSMIDASDACAHPDQISCNAALNACRRAGEWVPALGLLEKMPELRLTPDEISYNCVMSSCEQTSNWRLALDLFFSMQSSELQIGTVAVSSAMSVCRASGRWRDALRLSQLMAESFIESDQISMTTLIGACDNGGQWSLALCIFEQQDLPEFDIAFASAAIKACSTRGQWLQSFQLFHSMLNASSQPDLLCYTMLVHSCGKGNQVVLASELLRDMPMFSLIPDTAIYNSAINACVGHSWMHALALFNEMQRAICQPNMLTCTSVLAALQKDAQWQTAVEILRQMVKIRVDPDAASLACNWHHLLPNRHENQFEQLRSYKAAVESIATWQMIAVVQSRVEWFMQGHASREIQMVSHHCRLAEDPVSGWQFAVQMISEASRAQLLDAGLAEAATCAACLKYVHVCSCVYMCLWRPGETWCASVAIPRCLAVTTCGLKP